MLIRKITFLLVSFALISPAVVSAQSAILSAGGNNIGSGGTVSYSVGQVDYTHITASEGSISLGVQQSYIQVMVNTQNVLSDYSAIVYPNPVSGTLTLQVNIPEVQLARVNPSLELYDPIGNLLLIQVIESDNTRLSIDQLPGGVYFLKVTCPDKEIQTFKIFKTN
jgi:Secretion system C-terminal sorting domain